MLLRPRREARRRSIRARGERGSTAMALVARGPTRKSCTALTRGARSDAASFLRETGGEHVEPDRKLVECVHLVPSSFRFDPLVQVLLERHGIVALAVLRGEQQGHGATSLIYASSFTASSGECRRSWLCLPVGRSPVDLPFPARVGHRVEDVITQRLLNRREEHSFLEADMFP